MAGKARNITKTPPDPRVKEHTFNLTPGFSAGTTGTASSPTIKNNQFLSRQGGVLAGIQGSLRQTIAIASGVLDLTTDGTNDLKPRKIIKISSQSGSTDTLDTIEWDGAEIQGAEITLIGTSGETITITHNSGVSGTLVTILCPDDSAATLAGDESIDLVYDSVADAWLVKGAGVSGATKALDNLASVAINTSLISDTDDTDDLGSASKQWKDIYYDGNLNIGTGGSSSATDTTIWADASQDMVLNVPTGDSIFFTEAAATMAKMSKNEFELRTVTEDGVVFRFNNNDVTTQSANDRVARIIWQGNDSDDADANYAIMDVEMEDPTAGAKEGFWSLAVMSGNTMADIMSFTGSTKIFRFASNVDVVRPNSDGLKELGAASFHWDDVFSETFTLRGSGGNTTASARTIYADSTFMRFNMPTGDAFEWTVNGERQMQLTASSLVLQATNNNQCVITTSNQWTGGTEPYVISTLRSKGLNDNATPAAHTFSAIQTFVTDKSDTTEDGAMEFRISQSGLAADDISATSIMWFRSTAGTQQISVFDNTPAGQQTSTNTAPTADLTYSANERDMIQDMWDALVAYGWLDES